MVVGGESVPLVSAEEIHRRRCLAARWLEWACANGEVGTDHAKYRAVVEGRSGPDYWSCADLAHWLAFRLGCRERWVNRDEHHGWRMGKNISRIVGASRPWKGEQLFAGDLIVVANRWPSGQDAHAVCVITHEGKRLCTAEYGQPGGALRQHRIVSGMIGKRRRRIRTVLPLATMLERAARAGELVDPEEIST